MVKEKKTECDYLYILMGQLFTAEPTSPDVIAVLTCQDKAEDFLVSIKSLMKDNPDELGFDGDFEEKSLSGYNSFHLWRVPNFDCIFENAKMEEPMKIMLIAQIDNFDEDVHLVKGDLPPIYEYKSIFELMAEQVEKGK